MRSQYRSGSHVLGRAFTYNDDDRGELIDIESVTSTTSYTYKYAPNRLLKMLSLIGDADSVVLRLGGNGELNFAASV